NLNELALKLAGLDIDE
nr:Chain D, cAMP-dependent protein kinase inhibitor alpha [Homo sapiens]